MKRKRTYTAQPVDRVRVSDLLPLLVAGCIVAIDVAKAKFMVGLATWTGEVVQLIRFEHPTQTRLFMTVVEELQRCVPRVRVAMEPTGTYGDALRYQIHKLGIEIHMVSPKKTHDAMEVFDGVPSMHDAKSAALIAKVAAMGLSREWQPTSEGTRTLRALVDTRGHVFNGLERCLGQLESLLARHWPEVRRWLDPRSQRSATSLLENFPSPQHVTRDPEGARELLRKASRGTLSSQAIDGVIADAATSLGVPPVEQESKLIAMLASEVRAATARLDELDDEIAAVGKDDEVFVNLAPLTGRFTAAVLITRCNPKDSGNAKKLEKACGLNLKERSSGEHKGMLSISKRGPAHVRQVLYLFALRIIASQPIARAWYEARRAYSKDSKMSAVVALMRKLTRALFHVARGKPFDATKLFDVRRLKIETTNTPDTPRARIAPRTKPRSIVSARKRGRAESASAST